MTQTHNLWGRDDACPVGSSRIDMRIHVGLEGTQLKGLKNCLCSQSKEKHEMKQGVQVHRVIFLQAFLIISPSFHFLLRWQEEKMNFCF